MNQISTYVLRSRKLTEPDLHRKPPASGISDFFVWTQETSDGDKTYVKRETPLMQISRHKIE